MRNPVVCKRCQIHHLMTNNWPTNQSFGPPCGWRMQPPAAARLIRALSAPNRPDWEPTKPCVFSHLTRSNVLPNDQITLYGALNWLVPCTKSPFLAKNGRGGIGKSSGSAQIKTPPKRHKNYFFIGAWAMHNLFVSQRVQSVNFRPQYPFHNVHNKKKSCQNKDIKNK